MGGSKSSGGSDLSGLAKQLVKEGKPVRRGIIENLVDILGGGSGAANLPMIQSAVAQSKDATAQSLKQLNDQFAESKIAGTPFAENISSQARIAGNQQTAGIPSHIAQAFLQAFGAPAAYGGAATGLGGMAAGANAGNAFLGNLTGLGSGIGSMIGKGGSGGGIGSMFGKGGGLGKSASADLDAALAAAL